MAKGHFEFWLTFRWKDKSETGRGGLKPHLTPAQQTPPTVALTQHVAFEAQPAGERRLFPTLTVVVACLH